MADDVGSNAFLRRAGRHRHLLLIVTALLVLAVLGSLLIHTRPVLANKYVSRINQGQVQVCRVTSGGGVACPPPSSSLSKSYSASKSYSPSKSISTSTSLSPSAHT